MIPLEKINLYENFNVFGVFTQIINQYLNRLSVFGLLILHFKQNTKKEGEGQVERERGIKEIDWDIQNEGGGIPREIGIQSDSGGERCPCVLCTCLFLYVGILMIIIRIIM